MLYIIVMEKNIITLLARGFVLVIVFLVLACFLSSLGPLGWFVVTALVTIYVIDSITNREGEGK